MSRPPERPLPRKRSPGVRRSYSSPLTGPVTLLPSRSGRRSGEVWPSVTAHRSSFAPSTWIRLAGYIRSLGYACRVEHPIGDSDLLHIPIGLKAGFGELGRHGSIIHPQLGPLFRMGSVATSMPLAIDRPIDAGIARFCDACRACRKYCPADAIPDDRSPEAGKDHLGYDRYVVDTGRCFPYFAQHSYCSICLPVCVYNHKEWARDFEGFATRLFPTVLMPAAPSPAEPRLTQPAHWYAKLKR
jgi:ferredoxin